MKIRAIVIVLASAGVFCLQNRQKNCRVKNVKILLCSQRGALFCPTVGPITMRSRWGPSVGQQGPPKPHILEMSRKTLKLLCVNIFLFHTILQIKGSIMPSSFSSSSPPNSPIILDSEASTIVLSDSDSDDSLSSSIFGFTCEICKLRAKDAIQLEYKYLQDDLPLLDSDGVHWGKCDACGTCVHLVCWEESIGDKIQWDNRFYCCKYVVEWCPIGFFYLLNYIYLVLQATNMPSNKARQPPNPAKPQSGKRPQGKSNHKGDKLQKWDVLDMRNALVQYFSQRAPG